MAAGAWQMGELMYLLVLADPVILPVHISLVARQVIIGTAANVWQVAMRVQVGQIRPPGPETGVKLR